MVNTCLAIWRATWSVLRLVLTPVRLPFNTLAHWLHTRWPAGRVEKLPAVSPDGTTNVAGLYIVGDLTGIPLLKFAADSGARAVQHILADRAFQQDQPRGASGRASDGVPGEASDGVPDGASGGAQVGDAEVLDLLIVGAGVSGMAAALEARKAGLRFAVVEATEAFSTIVNFPAQKPIYTYPTAMVPAGDMRLRATVKESLIEELRAQTLDLGVRPVPAMVEKVLRRGKCLEAVVRQADSILARRVIVAIGRSGNFRRLGVPGEDLAKVSNRLHDPKDFAARRVLVVGGGDSALESAIAIAECGGHVDLSYRRREFSRPKADNIAALERLQADPMAQLPDTTPDGDRVTTPAGSYLDAHRRAGSVTLHLGTTVTAITAEAITLQGVDGAQRLANDAVLTMIGREAPLDFFRRSGVRIKGETRGLGWIGITLFFLLIWFIYDWKNGSSVTNHVDIIAAERFQAGAIDGLGGLGRLGRLGGLGSWWQEQVADRSTLVGTLAVSMQGRSFYYTLLYTFCIGWFGVRRILRRRTPYVTLQTLTLFAVQFGPLFLLPELILPWMGYNGYFDAGWGQSLANHLFESYISADQWAAGQWPDWGHPRAYWRAYGFILAFPLLVYNVLTDLPIQGWLWISAVQTFVIIPLIVWKWGKGAYCGWICSCGGLAETMGDAHRHKMFHGPQANRANMVGQVVLGIGFALLGLRIWGWVYRGGAIDLGFKQHLLEGSWYSYKWLVDVLLGGILGVGFYFKYSGRIWCRFACPLAALMHIYARFTRFRILADKGKCISCNVCTSNCHMGIDVMNFANKGMPMADPQCVRCSACVQMCPTGVLQFGEVDRAGEVLRIDRLTASPVVRAERRQG